MVYSRSCKFINCAKCSSNGLVRSVFHESLAYTFAGHNSLFGCNYLKSYFAEDEKCAEVLRAFLTSNIVCDVRNGSSSIDTMLRTIATA